MKIVPVFLIKNEEIWIKRVVTPFANLFEHVIVADTGSTDSTVHEVMTIANNVHVQQFPPCSPRELTACRQWMQQEAKEKYGASHIFLVDGDELYPTKYLKYIIDNMMPEDSISGYTWGVEYRELPNGECWSLGVGCNRQAIIPVDSVWKGEYPFESPSCYLPGDPKNHYFHSPDESYHWYHLHQMRRSRERDHEVYLRMEKKNQFSLRDHPEIQPVTLWLKSQEEYQDE